MVNSKKLKISPNIYLKESLQNLIDGKNLSRSDSNSLIKKIMSGEFSTAQTAALMVALRAKGETVDEIVGAVDVMREMSKRVNLGQQNFVDLCGTGGDGMSTFNVSTAAMFVVAGAGLKVAKHGGRAVSSNTGSADILEFCGVKLDLSTEQIESCLDETGIAFMFAPNHHPAMKNVADVRRQLGIRTMFNILGPLINPAGAKRQLIGVFDRNILFPLAEVLRELGSEHVFLVNAEDGLDEVSLSGLTSFVELKNGKIMEGKIDPKDFGFTLHDKTSFPKSIIAEDAKTSKKLIIDAISGVEGCARDMVIINAAVALYVGGRATSIKDGIQLADNSVSSGSALNSFENFVKFTSSV